FCCISLSDLLTPWPVIENRLQAAAQGDFVVAFYNPRSQRRTEGIRQAQAILLQHRDPTTPVAIAKNLYREGESIHITTLGHMDPEAIDMLTLVLVGNSSSLIYPSGELKQGQPRWIITPRGYANKKPG
ncbi:MAG: precorrin-3B C(17)-methyltransferase, partial [Synechococcaceae cyanobacterium SM2_3_2]|nr:precorrin-3B C(17)-methyltransferase [Synechococcaceae cyanobacterium SM2_3_2]